jgi:hypothetical protein
MWLDLPFAQVSRSVEQNMHTTFFPKSSSRIRRTTVLRMFKASAIILDAIRRSFLTKSATAAMCASFRVDFGRPPLSSSSTSSLPSRNREYHLKSFISSEPHSHKPFAPVLVFLSQTDRLWSKILWKLHVHFRHLWRIKKTDFTRQVIIRTLSKIKETRCVNGCWLIVLSWWVGG